MPLQHPWLANYPIPENAQRLILGTHPPMPYNALLRFYYGNMYEFWRLLSHVYPNETFFINSLPDLDSIQRFLEKYQFGITDMVYETDGSPFSIDDKMVVETLNPFLIEWLLNSKVKDIYITSFSGKNGALALFKRWLRHNYGIILPNVNVWPESAHITFSIGLREFRLIKLYSPSPTARKGIARSRAYLQWLGEHPQGTIDAFRIDWYRKYLPLPVL
jgi:G:T/U-mismatch repair DNA glycosylase